MALDPHRLQHRHGVIAARQLPGGDELDVPSQAAQGRDVAKDRVRSGIAVAPRQQVVDYQRPLRPLPLRGPAGDQPLIAGFRQLRGAQAAYPIDPLQQGFQQRVERGGIGSGIDRHLNGLAGVFDQRAPVVRFDRQRRTDEFPPVADPAYPQFVPGQR